MPIFSVSLEVSFEVVLHPHAVIMLRIERGELGNVGTPSWGRQSTSWRSSCRRCSQLQTP